MKRTQEEILLLYDKYYDMVWRICIVQLGNIHDAYDGTQETFMRLMQYTKNFNDEEHEKAWMIRTAVNYCKDVLKSHWRKKQSDIDITEFMEKISLSDEHHEVFETMMSMPERYRIILYLYYEGYSLKEIYSRYPEAKWYYSTNGVIDGAWNLRIPFFVDTDSLQKFEVNKVMESCELDHVDVSDEQIVVYSDKFNSIYVFDQDGKEINASHSARISGKGVTFHIDKETRKRFKKLNICVFASTDVESDTDTYEDIKKLSDISVTIDLEK